MINYTQEEFDTLGTLSLICDCCGISFTRTKKQVRRAMRDGSTKSYCCHQCYSSAITNERITKVCSNCGSSVTRRTYAHENVFCNKSCANFYRHRVHPRTDYKKTKTVKCAMCKEKVIRNVSELKYSKSGLFFCNRVCLCIYNGKHNRSNNNPRGRSKLELYLESELRKRYPTIKFLFNEKKVIAYELDIYIPELKLAVEINGISHYKDIYKQKPKLERTQEIDREKIELCQQQGIKLIVIDSTVQKHFNSISSDQFFQTIRQNIDNILKSQTIDQILH